MGTLIGILLATTVVATAPSAPDGIEINDRIEYYRITGDNSRELHARMRETGPPDPVTGKRYDGRAEWNVAWRYALTSWTGRCRLTDVDVTLDVVITLPQWQPDEDASPKLVAGWPHYLEHLTAHEHGHRAIGVQAATAVRDALQAVSPDSDCDRLRAEADTVAKAALKRFSLADREYDRDTGHGAKQGVQLP